MKIRKALFLVATKEYFYSHRASLARFLKDEGIEVSVACKMSKTPAPLLDFSFQDIDFQRKSLNPLSVLRGYLSVLKITANVRPNILLAIALKPAISGIFCSFLTGVPIVITVTGLGLIYVKTGLVYRAARLILELYFMIFSRVSKAYFIFQNHDDFDYFIKKRIVQPSKATVILSSGVDLAVFKPSVLGIQVNPQEGKIQVLFPARMLWSKGVGQFFELAKTLKRIFPHVRFVLAGDCDSQNTDSVSHEQLKQWTESGCVDWLGYVTDMPALFKESSIVVFPSEYREGVPKCLIEAAACGCAIVTLDKPGCKEAVKNNNSGFVVPPGDFAALTTAVKTLLSDQNLLLRFRAQSRIIAEAKFDVRLINKLTFDFYNMAYLDGL